MHHLSRIELEQRAEQLLAMLRRDRHDFDTEDEHRPGHRHDQAVEPVEARDHPRVLARLLVGELHLHQVSLHIRRRLHRAPPKSAKHTTSSCYGMQCSIPPLLTHVADTAPHASLQKALPPTPTVHRFITHAEGVAPASTSTGVPPPSLRSHWLTVPLGNSHRLPSVQLAVPQQKTGAAAASHFCMRQASPGMQSHAPVQAAPTPFRSPLPPSSAMPMS